MVFVLRLPDEGNPWFGEEALRYCIWNQQSQRSLLHPAVDWGAADRIAISVVWDRGICFDENVFSLHHMDIRVVKVLAAGKDRHIAINAPTASSFEEPNFQQAVVERRSWTKQVNAAAIPAAIADDDH